MKSKNLFIVAILVCLSIGLKAQDRYEQAIVTQANSGGSAPSLLIVSMEGKEYKRQKLEKADIADPTDFSLLLKQVALLRNEGWEVWNSSPNAVLNYSSSIVYFLRRKLKQ
jgi:hypothetical protein